ncbi:hypothetical protein [uncultured Porphyromonas sp.]|uniref:hypothetical protein n=1 Tax=uncultured Porphyromonas sp. TaxID=159274 RepID=UPI0026030BCC|nr:hypothetical protein [uncultured Porphyromonas sp.]
MKQKKYEAPTLSVEEVRIEKAFLADPTASGGLPSRQRTSTKVPDGAQPGVGDDGSIDDWFTLE